MVVVDPQAQLQASGCHLRPRGSSEEGEGSAVGKAESLARARTGSQNRAAKGAEQMGSGQPTGEEKRGQQPEAELGAEGSAGDTLRQQRPLEAARLTELVAELEDRAGVRVSGAGRNS